ncbi:TPA: MBL fold metallo-hydrolase [Legionella pneumophila]|nr:MBL fold metallo-hydrolase [Legionella pneumophila]HBD7283594.1 MBL fold metallo-hydrolase [Legionella pneumophila]HBD9439253.1 MBL fold metallo-hydrolase [Legionella pneumophila]HEN8241113.1 MBL fold metallo-hydrolase [Legionella pneumophila]
MKVKPFFDQATSTFTYVVNDENTKKCAVIDPVLDLELRSGRISTDSNQKIIDYVNEQKLSVDWILETHAHADHLSGAHELKKSLGGQIGIGSNITEVQRFWADFMNVNIHTDGSQFDRLFKDNDTFMIGDLTVKVMHTPGHTPACICYLINDTVFVGDTIFLPHLGTARADFPGGSSEMLYNSIQKLLSLPDETIMYVCHDYPEQGCEPACKATVCEQKNSNIMIGQSIDKETYMKKRNARDKSLAVPKLLLPSIQVNIQAGELMKDTSGQAYLKIPLNKL